MTQRSAFQKIIDLAFGLVRSTTFRTQTPEDDILSETLNAGISRAAFDDLFNFLHKDCPKPEKPKVVITVEGGVVTSVNASEPMEVTVRDLDPKVEAGVQYDVL